MYIGSSLPVVGELAVLHVVIGYWGEYFSSAFHYHIFRAPTVFPTLWGRKSKRSPVIVMQGPVPLYFLGLLATLPWSLRFAIYV